MRDLASASVLPGRNQDKDADGSAWGLPRRVGLFGEDREVCRFKWECYKATYNYLFHTLFGEKTRRVDQRLTSEMSL